MSSNAKVNYTLEQMNTAKQLQSERSDIRPTKRRQRRARDKAGASAVPPPIQTGYKETSMGADDLKTRVEAEGSQVEDVEEDLMDMRTPLHTGGFGTARPSKDSSPGTALASTASAPAAPAHARSSIIDSSIAAEQIGIGTLTPEKPPTIADRLLHQDLLHKCGGLNRSQWAK